MLGAGDFKSDQSPLVSRVPTTTIVHMSTLVFGRFSGARLSAAMVFQTNIRPAVVLGWQDLAGCRASGAPTLFQEATQSSALRSECASLQPVAEPLAASSTAMAETRGVEVDELCAALWANSHAVFGDW